MGTYFGLFILHAKDNIDLEMDEGYRERWLDRFGLAASTWRREANVYLRQLPFTEIKVSRPLISSLFSDVPGLLRGKGDPETQLLAEAFGWCCFSLWQCGSAFPAFPENYASFLLAQLFKAPRPRNSDATLLARLIVDSNGQEGCCGFNKLTLAEPEAIRESERRMLEGGYEFYLKAKEKYEEYLFYLRGSDAFKREWREIKDSFPTLTRRQKITRRSLIPERNWEHGPGAQFTSRAKRFQAVFDLFCWKYFLWGMRGDEPLLMKSSVVFTPLGTQIFIPGYLSLDSKRDLDFARINAVHQARGIRRQGPGFSTGRQQTLAKRKAAKVLERVARKNGMRGEALYEHLTRELGLPVSADFRSVRKLLEK